MTSVHNFRRFIWVVFASSLIAATYVYFRHGAPGVGAIVGACVGATIYFLERFALRRNSGGFFDPLPFLPYLALRSLLYSVILLLGNVLAQALGRGGFGAIDLFDAIFSIVLCVSGNLLVGVTDLLGPGVLFAFAAGRYYRPRVEERAVLFIDMRSSTAIAEQLGELRFFNLLNRFILDLTVSISDNGGEIHKYVGDEIIATWKLAPGSNEASCVRACFAALACLNANASSYEREFGLRADFRAGLHCGPVVVGELGNIKKEIALIGDTMNTAARIQQACRELNCRVLASAALLARLSGLPAGISQRALGSVTLRGKAGAIELHAVELSSGASSPAKA